MRNKKRVLISLLIVVLITTMACSLEEEINSFFGDSGRSIADEYDPFNPTPFKLPTTDRSRPTPTPQFGNGVIPTEPTASIEAQEIESPVPDSPDEESPLPNKPNEVTSGTDAPEQSIPGAWSGTAQWLCTNNAPCQVTLDFASDGSLSSTVACPTLTLTTSGTWSLSDDQITLVFDGYAEIWSGTVTDNGISGSITGGGEDCDGVWSVDKS